MKASESSETQSTLRDFLDRLAAKMPTPGAGGAAALAGAVGCALARMVTVYSAGKSQVGRGRLPDTEAEQKLAATLSVLERADQMLRQLVDEDAAAYTQLVAARRAAKQDTGKQVEYQESVRLAATVPLEIAAVASTGLEALDTVKSLTSKYFHSDLGAATAIMHAAAHAAAWSVRVNLPEISDPAQRNQIGEQLRGVLAHAEQHAASVTEFVAERMRA
jgi:formiminotetrahydrofolate cyclodeaminase